MKYAAFLLGLLLVSLAYIAHGSPQESPQELQNSEMVILVRDLPQELHDLYDLIVDPQVDDINKENYIWRCFELLNQKKYKYYEWFYYWLVDISGSGYQPGRRTPKHGGPGGRTPKHGGPGGRTPKHGGPGGRTPKHGGPGGRTPKHGRGGPGGRTRGHRRHIF